MGMISRWGTALKLTVVITTHSCGCIEIIALVWFNNYIL